jgi:hypothetical protein
MLCLVIIGCEKEYPPFDEYQIVGFTPMDSVKNGRLFMANDILYVMYDTIYSNVWSRVREYSLADPNHPAMLDTFEIQPVSQYEYIAYQDSFVFFHHYYGFYDDLSIINLSTHEAKDISIPGFIYDVAHANDFVFISSSDGFRVWHNSETPSEVFNDSVYHNTGHITLRDTILLEIYRQADDEYKFWNISNPSQPQVIVQGSLHHQVQPIGSISMTDQYVFCFDYYDAVYRLSYALGDSLYSSGAVYEDYSEYDMTDTLIFLVNQDRFITLNVDDLDYRITIVPSGGLYTSPIIAVETYEDRIFLLIRNKGIEIYQWRTQ